MGLVDVAAYAAVWQLFHTAGAAHSSLHLQDVMTKKFSLISHSSI